MPNEHFYTASATALQEAAVRGSLAISDIVYAELCIHFQVLRQCDDFLESNETREQALPREAHFSQSALGGFIGNKEANEREF